MRKKFEKHGSIVTKITVTENFTMCEMFARFMWFKRSEGLATRIIEEYGIHFI
jgi:integrase/recombinase XerD